MLALALAAALTLASQIAAPVEAPLEATPLDDAEAARVAGDAAACGQRAQDTLATGTLDVPAVARAWTLRGRCFTLAGDADRAERSYAVALRVQPALAGDASFDGDAGFAQARRALPKVPGLAARAAFIQAGSDEDTLEIELLGDDLLLVKGARVVRSAPSSQPANEVELARVPLEAGQARHKVSGLEGGREGLFAVLVDKHGNALLRVPVDPTVQRVFTPAPSDGAAGHTPTLLTTLGATAIGAGLVGVVTSGIALAAIGPTALEEGQVWVVGVGASTGLFLVGAGLVVVDQGL